MFTIHAHVVIEDQQSAKVLAELQALKEAVMTQADTIRALAGRLDAATNEIATDLKALRDKVAEGTVTEADLAPLDATITRLEALGADPENPVPDVENPPA